jgi:hypothetical protein
MLHHFNSPWISVQQVAKHQEIKDKLMPIMLAYYEEHLTDPNYIWGKSQTVNSHYHQDLTVFDADMIQEIVWNPLDAMFEEQKQSGMKMPEKSHLIGMWWNIYPPHSWAPTHKHLGYDISGTYFLELDEPNGLVFVPPCIDGYFPFSSENYFTDEITQESNVVFFPSGLAHYVEPCNKRRMSVSFNILCDAPEKQVNPLMRLIT